MTSTEISVALETGVSFHLPLLAERIRERLRALDIYEREASRRAGLGLGFVGDILSGRSKNPALPRLEALALALECDVDYLTGKQDEVRKDSQHGLSMSPRAEVGGGPDSLIPLFAVEGMPTTSWFSVSKQPAAKTAGLPNLAHVPTAYAVSVPTGHNAPRYMVGEIVYLNPALQARVGDFVFLRRKDGICAIGQVDSIGDNIGLSFLLPDTNASLVEREDIASMHRIIGSITP